jgi:iron(III) transport system ATP-binding protein
MATDTAAETRNRTDTAAPILRSAEAGAGNAEALEGTAALRCQGLTKRFQETQAVQDFTITVARGHVVALLGPSGCGKTTALRLIAGFDSPDSGSVTVGDQCVFQPGRNLPPEKRRIGMVFQEGALFPHLTVEQNVAYGLSRRNGRKERVQQVLAMVGLEHLNHRMPHELSGGQQQRVALARALAPQPEVLLLDEPFSNLDPGLRDQVRRDVLEILKANNVTAIFVTHDQEEALFVGDVIAVMRNGRIEQIASPEEIFHHPATRFVAEFIGTVDFLPGWRSEDRLMSEVGSVEWPEDCPSDADLEVMVRPDCLECSPSEDGAGVIVSREFRGAFYLYKVSLTSGNEVRCLLPHTHEYDVGSRVAVDLRCGHSLQPFVQGQAVHSH